MGMRLMEWKWFLFWRKSALEAQGKQGKSQRISSNFFMSFFSFVHHSNSFEPAQKICFDKKNTTKKVLWPSHRHRHRSFACSRIFCAINFKWRKIPFVWPYDCCFLPCSAFTSYSDFLLYVNFIISYYNWALM